ncbi:MAG: hypothetical protein OQK69_02830 [Gammaproteobacteria bacterium]|nr:hypothetical protein [Gammaproteobacteria bacterium]
MKKRKQSELDFRKMIMAVEEQIEENGKVTIMTIVGNQKLGTFDFQSSEQKGFWELCLYSENSELTISEKDIIEIEKVIDQYDPDNFDFIVKFKKCRIVISIKKIKIKIKKTILVPTEKKSPITEILKEKGFQSIDDDNDNDNDYKIIGAYFKKYKYKKDGKKYKISFPKWTLDFKNIILEEID